MRNQYFVALGSLILLFTIGISLNGFSAELTSVMSSFDENDPFDGSIGVRWNWSKRKSNITREFICKNIAGVCPQTNKIVDVNEISSERTQNSLDILLRVGIYKDLELFINLPIMLGDKTTLGFASGVDHGNSTIDPDGKPSLFELPNEGISRSGFGDMSIGLKYAPFQQWRDSFYPSWTIGVTYTIPTGGVRKGSNQSPGYGLHVLKLESAASRRIMFFEPYFSLFGNLKFPAGDTLFKNYGSTQNHVWPGHELGIALGVEFFPWEIKRSDGKKTRYVSIDVGFSAMYTFQGRGYTDLSDAFATSKCNNDPQCTLTRYTRTMENDPVQSIVRMDGITDVGPYGTYSVWGGFNVQPIDYVQLSFRFTYSRETSHFLTYADVGDDLDGSLPNGMKGVNFKNSLGQNEFNPVYNSEVDDPGKRLRSQGANIFGIMLMLTGKY